MKSLICGSTLQAICICDGLAKMWPELLGHGLKSFCGPSDWSAFPVKKVVFLCGKVLTSLCHASSLGVGMCAQTPSPGCRQSGKGLWLVLPSRGSVRGVDALYRLNMFCGSAPSSLRPFMMTCRRCVKSFRGLPSGYADWCLCKQCGTLCLPRTVLVYVQREFSPLGGPFKGRVWFLLRMGLQGRVAVTPGSACHAGPLVPTLWALQAPGVWAV